MEEVKPPAALKTEALNKLLSFYVQTYYCTERFYKCYALISLFCFTSRSQSAIKQWLLNTPVCMKCHKTEAGIQSETSVPVVINSFVNYDSRHTALFML